ncbi:MAG: glycoside hydrolase family protein [Pseudomonadota bacterium]
MKPRHQVSRAAIELIKTFEGYRRKAAQLPDGRWTIGYGHTLTAREGAEVSADDAEALLMYDLITVAHAVNEHCYTPLTQNQFDALSCFAFNIGTDNFRRSSVLRRVNEGQLLQAACAMEMWRKADFEGERIVIDALVRRRSAEKTLFLTPTHGWVPAPSSVLRPRVDYDAVNAVPRETPTPVVANTHGDQIVAERDLAPQPQPAEPPVAPLATETAAASVGAQLEQLLHDPVLDAPQTAQPLAIVPVEPEEDDFETVWRPEADAGPTVFVMDETAVEETTPGEEAAIVVDAGPVQLAEPQSPPVLTMVTADPALVPTPEPETLAAFAPSDAVRVDLPEPSADGAPNLFDAVVTEIGASRPLVSEDHIRRLVRQDEYATMTDDIDPAFVQAPTDPVQVKGLPLMGLAIAGVGFFAGGVYWALQARAGEGMTGSLSIGLGVAVGGALLFGLAVYLFLQTLANAPIEDDEELSA